MLTIRLKESPALTCALKVSLPGKTERKKYQIRISTQEVF